MTQALHVGDAVDLGSLEGGASLVELAAAADTGGGFAGGSEGGVDDDIEAFAGLFGVFLVELGGAGGLACERDLLLELHDLAAAAGFVLGRDGEGFVLFHGAGDGAFLVAVLEDADGFELHLFDELEELLVVGFGLSGEAGDEGGADGEVGHAPAELADDVCLLLTGDVAAHEREDAVGSVLEGDVEVGKEVRVLLVDELGESVDDRVREVGRIRVHEAHPAAASRFGHGVRESFEQRGQAADLIKVRLGTRAGAKGFEPRSDVVAVACGVLADEEELVGSVVDEFAALGGDAVGPFAPHLAADARDRAEGAVLIAPLADSEVGVVARREAEARGIVFEIADALAVLALDRQADGLEAAVFGGGESVAGDPVLGLFRRRRRPGEADLLARDDGRANGFHDLVAVEDADHRVDAGGPFEHLGAVALDEAPRDDDAADLAAVLGGDGVLDDAQALILRSFEEPAGVDDDRVGPAEIAPFGVDRNGHDSGLSQTAEHFLGVDEVLGAAQADESDGFDGLFALDACLFGFRRGPERGQLGDLLGRGLATRRGGGFRGWFGG
jgi:hypothetical protein